MYNVQCTTYNVKKKTPKHFLLNNQIQIQKERTKKS